MFHVFVLLVPALLLLAGAVLFAEDFQTIASAVPLVTTAETLIATGNPLPLQSTAGKAVISAKVWLTTGTSTTAVTLKIYRGTSITGTQVGGTIAQAGSFTVGSPALFSLDVVDPLGAVSGAQYCFSATQTGAAANGSAVAASIDTKVLSG